MSRIHNIVVAEQDTPKDSVTHTKPEDFKLWKVNNAKSLIANMMLVADVRLRKDSLN
jgi:hypothetical protein